MASEPPSNPFLQDWHTPTTARKPPGMTWEDWQAWRPWLDGPGARWRHYSYDVPLYVGTELPPRLAPNMLDMWTRNNAKRADAIGWHDDRYDIFEARRLAGWSAVAQLLGYSDLLTLNHPELARGELYLITEQCDDAVRMLAARRGVKTWCVGEKSPVDG